jgi:hypothetical protein
MKTFHCDRCGQLVFFENTLCLSCGYGLVYLPDTDIMVAYERVQGAVQHAAIAQSAIAANYRLCSNYDLENVCNWAVRSEDPNPLCISCRLTRVIPDLSKPGNRDAWRRLSVAKRRLVHGLMALKLPFINKTEDPQNGLAFEFREDSAVPGAAPVLTSHDNGLIVINVAEADDVTRETRRHQFHEPYRTILGHFRHETGHYYWDRLVADSPRLDPFRDLFGDERENYDAALQRHYNEGAPPDWQHRYISAYASTHPWEDWAECWAHYLHMVDTLETAQACGMSLHPVRRDEPMLETNPDIDNVDPDAFDRMIRGWLPVTYVLNNLNRGLGLPDSYPFVLSPPVLDKLRFVHETIHLRVTDVPKQMATNEAK